MNNETNTAPETGDVEQSEQDGCTCIKQLEAQLPDGLRMATHMRYGFVADEKGRRAVFGGPYPSISTYNPNAKRKKAGPNFTPSFCPFCGKKYPAMPTGAQQ